MPIYKRQTIFSLLVVLLTLIACGQGQVADRLATRRADTGSASSPAATAPPVVPISPAATTAPLEPTVAAPTTPIEAATPIPDQPETVVATLAGNTPEKCGNSLAPGPIEQGYGADGPYTVLTQAIPHPAWAGHEVTLFYPAGLESQAVPVIFFAHGFAATSTTWYEGFAKHVASLGFVFVYSPYPIRGTDFTTKYDQMWSGYMAAVQQSKQPLDLTRVGFAGHSLGGGAVPALAYRGLVEQGWGTNGALLYLMAPWYMLDVSNSQLQQLPAHTKMQIQVYGDDLTNDPRIAIDIYRSIPVPASEKDYVVINSAQQGDCELKADHLTAGSAPNMINALDYYGVYRMFDALADYAFNGREIGKRVALGHGDPLQMNMGVWPDTGAPLADLVSEYANPTPNRPESAYMHPYDAPANPRQ